MGEGEELLGDLEPKAHVLRFLVELHSKKKLLRKQISHVFATVLNVKAWKTVLASDADMMKDLPEDLKALMEEPKEVDEAAKARAAKLRAAVKKAAAEKAAAEKREADEKAAAKMAKWRAAKEAAAEKREAAKTPAKGWAALRPNVRPSPLKGFAGVAAAAAADKPVVAPGSKAPSSAAAAPPSLLRRIAQLCGC